MTDEASDFLKPVYQGPSIAPEPPFSPDDPWGHKARLEAQGSLSRPSPETSEEYTLAIEQWRSERPVIAGPDDADLVDPETSQEQAPFYRLKGQEFSTGVATKHEVCPVCGAPPESMPGCYVPYAGRRWDCFEYIGRNLTGEERRAIVEHEKKEPRYVSPLPADFGLDQQ